MAPCLEHGISRKYRCKFCPDSSSICGHSKRRSRCPTCNPARYLVSITNSRIHAALKKKTKRTIEYLGCDAETFKKHIEDQFEEGMNFDNIHIDHIIPIMYNNPTQEEIINRLHYTNCQPMYPSQNCSKGNKYCGKYKDNVQSVADSISARRKTRNQFPRDSAQLRNDEEKTSTIKTN